MQRGKIQWPTEPEQLTSNGAGITVRTQDKDHAGDEEFRGRRSSYLEQFASRPANHNSLPLDVRSTFEGSPVRLIDSAPEDYLGRALQVYSSSSSS